MLMMMLMHLPNAQSRQNIEEGTDYKIHLQEVEYSPDDLEQDFNNSDLGFFLAHLDFSVSW